MMADQPLPPLEVTPMLAEVPLVPHMLSGDSMQQMIYVHMNPGEPFTVRTEDGHIQYITGPAHVPVVSHNGNMPPIFLPPGYMSQVVEDNGMRKVLLVPHAVEFHHSLPPVPPPLPHYPPPHPALLHHPHIYPAELPPHYIHQLPALPVYAGEPDLMCHGVCVPVKDERSVKMPEQVQSMPWRLKGGQVGGANGVPAPCSSPASLLKGGQPLHNGHSKGHAGSTASPKPPRYKASGRHRASPPSEMENRDAEEEVRRVQELLSTVAKPTVGCVTCRSAVLSWRPPVSVPSGADTHTHPQRAPLLSYELALSQGGAEGDFTPVYQGKDTTCTVGDLSPAKLYYVRVCVACSSVRGSPSAAVGFTTLCSVPDAPCPPRLVMRTKSSLGLQWKTPNDNGSKITSYLLECSEARQSAFKEAYYGHAKHYRVMRLTPSTHYEFRIAAKNDMGMSAFSEVVSCCTAGCVPAPPAPPQLTGAGVAWLSLEWSAPCGPPSKDPLTYTLEMEEEGSGYGFRPRHNGEELSCTVRNLKRCSSYRVRVLAANSEGRSQPSAAVEYCTNPDKPGRPSRPGLKGLALPNSLHSVWEAPEDDGGSPITQYVLQLCLNGHQWDTVYSGPLREHVCEGLQVGTCYQLRVCCHSAGGQSEVSESLSVQTAPVPPGPCQALRPAGGATSSAIALTWDAPVCDGGAPVSQYMVEMSESEQGLHQQLYQDSDIGCTLSRLLPGRSYCFWVKAANSAGWGPLSDMCLISTAPGPPEQCGPPELTVKTATCVLASWVVPESNGAEVSAFRLEWGIDQEALAVVYSGSSLQYDVRDLLPATDYYCRVQAINVAGSGVLSDVAVVTTPPSVPAAVQDVEEMEEQALSDVMTVAVPTSLALQWKEPCCNGAEILGYNIDFGQELPLSVGRTTHHILENLQPDTTYRIRVQAVNSEGSGPFSGVLRARTRPLPPDPPVLECAASGPQSLKLRWSEGPTRPQHSRGTHYCLHMQASADRSVCIYSGPCHTFKVQRLSEATLYQFSIQAHGEAGMGPLSPLYSFSTSRCPPPQLKAPRVELVDWNVCMVRWDTVQPMKRDQMVYTLQLLRGREVEQLYRGPASSFSWHGAVAGGECRLRVCAGRRGPDGAELWGQYSLSAGLPAAEPPRDRDARALTTHAPQPRGARTLTDEQFAMLLLAGFATLAILFAVLIQYFVIE